MLITNFISHFWSLAMIRFIYIYNQKLFFYLLIVSSESIICESIISESIMNYKVGINFLI